MELVYKGEKRKSEAGQITQLNMALEQMYPNNEIDNLSFYGDIDTEKYYAFDIEVNNSRFELRYIKENGFIYKKNK